MLRQLGRDLLERFFQLVFVNGRIDLAAGLCGNLDHAAFGGERADISIAAADAGSFIILKVLCFNHIDLAVIDL